MLNSVTKTLSSEACQQIKMHERSGWRNASNATLSGSESVGPFRGRECRPSPGATDLAPSWATSNFGRTDLRRTTNNFFLAYVLNKHHAYHDPSEIDFARPTQAGSFLCVRREGIELRHFYLFWQLIGVTISRRCAAGNCANAQDASREDIERRRSAPR